MGKRIFYFLLTNVLVLLTISIIVNLIPGGLNYLNTTGGIDFGTLLILSAIIGFTGSIISLLISRWMAKRMMGVRIINPDQPAT